MTSISTEQSAEFTLYASSLPTSSAGGEEQRSTPSLRMMQREKKRRRVTSDVWKFIRCGTHDEGSVAPKCLQCNKFFGEKTSTTTLQDYLRNHGLLLEDDGQKRFSLDATIANCEQTPLEDCQVRFEMHLVRWILSYSLPFACVENEDNIKMIASLDPEVTVLGRQTVRNRAMALEEDMYLHMK